MSLVVESERSGAVVRASLVVAILAAMAFVAACSKSSDGGGAAGGKDKSATGDASQSGARKEVVAVNYPLAYFAQRIAGGAAHVVLPMPADVDPAFWNPTAEDIAAIQKADLILQNGATYEKWAETVSLPPSKCVNTSADFKARYRTIPGMITHSHGPEGEHSHAGTDFNTWVDPVYARAQAQAVSDALLRLVPSAQSAMRDSYDALAKDLRALDDELRAASEKIGKQPLIASHPVYGYVADRYGWNVKSLLWEPTEMPSEEQWGELAKMLADHPAKIFLWESEPDPAIAADLEKRTGMQGVVFDPCANRPDSGDYMTVMKANIARLRQAAGK